MISTFITSLRVGYFLGIRQIRRAKIGTTLLIISIMMLTFLNLVAISGILVGLIEGSIQANQQQYSGDVLVSELPNESYIENTQSLVRTLDTFPFVENYSTRLVSGGTVEANYQTRRDFASLANTVSTSFVGIDIEREDAVTQLSERIIEGEFLDQSESGYIVIGATLVERFSPFSDLFEPLKDIYPGTKVKLTVQGSGQAMNMGQITTSDGATGGNTRTQEFIVKGIVKSKVDEVSVRVFMTDNDFRRLTGRTTMNANEIAIQKSPEGEAGQITGALSRSGFDRYAKIQTAAEAIPRFLDNIKITFSILGNVIGSIGLVVASITIFIVIYINAVTRRKYIGILKAIGVRGLAIRFAYVMQALYYALIGSALGLFITYGLLVPLFQKHPLDFPFSDGILVAPLGGTIVKLIILLIVTLCAGLIPAWLIVRKNTLDSILGR